jgi:hypothetical protein
LFLGGDGEKLKAGTARGPGNPCIPGIPGVPGILDIKGLTNLSDLVDNPEISDRARRVLEYLAANGASFFGDMRKALTLSLHALNNALAELFWSGLVTNDVFSEILRVRRIVRENDEIPDERLEVTRPRSTLRSSPELAAARRAIRQVPGWSGRWSLLRTPSVLGEERSATEIAREQAGQLLQRYGIVAREVHRKEEMLPWGVIATDLQRMEMRGDIRRGYFLEGFSGMQFALPGAVENIRSVREADDGSIVVLNSCDPASPYGILEREQALQEQRHDAEEGNEEGQNGRRPHGQPHEQQQREAEDRSEEQMGGRHLHGTWSNPLPVQRTPSTFIVLRSGVPVMVMENYGKRVRTSDNAESTDTEAVRRGIGYLKRLLDLPEPLKPAKEITIELWNGERASASAAAGMLREEKFRGGAGQSMVYDGY